MCRNIRTLHHFRPPTTPEEIHAAALQYVRKVSGIREASSGVAARTRMTAERAKRAKDAETAFTRAVTQIAGATTKLLDALPARGEPRTRDGERAKARARWARREQAIKRA